MPVRGCNYKATVRNYSLCLHSFQTGTLCLAEAHSSSSLVYLSGMIAVDIALEVLKAGLRVRGIVRSAEKGQAVAKLLQSPDFEIIIVKDMAAGVAFHDAMKGASAAIQTASNHEFPSRLEEVRMPPMRGSMNILEAALANTTVKTRPHEYCLGF